MNLANFTQNNETMFDFGGEELPAVIDRANKNKEKFLIEFMSGLRTTLRSVFEPMEGRMPSWSASQGSSSSTAGGQEYKRWQRDSVPTRLIMGYLLTPP